MKRSWPVAVAGILTGVALYSVLAAVRPEGAREADPWRDAWLAEGLRVELTEASAPPEKRFMLVGLRPLFLEPEFAGSSLRTYTVEKLKVQVLELPSEALCLCQGLPDRTRCTDERGSVKSNGLRHFRREGRWMVVVQGEVRTFWLPMPVPEALLQRIRTAFQETARRRA